MSAVHRAAVLQAAGMPLARRGLHGVFLGSHAVAEGWVTRRQLKAGLYRRLLHNVYVDPALAVDHRLRAAAAMLVLPDEAAIGGISAAAWYGAPFAAVTAPVCVVVPPDFPWSGPRGIRVHRTPLAPEDILTMDDDVGVVRLTTAVRTAWDVATLETVPDAVAALDGMLRAGSIQPGDLDRLLASSAGRWRAARVRKVFPLADGRAQSPPESWVRVACVRSGLPTPVPQYVVEQHGVRLGEVDLAWPEHKVIVEYEGEYHFDGLQIVRDDRRYARLEAAGWTVIRLSSADVRRMDEVVMRIGRALGVLV